MGCVGEADGVGVGSVEGVEVGSDEGTAVGYITRVDSTKQQLV